MERVEASLIGENKQLEGIGGDIYQGSMKSPVPKTKSAVYPVTVTATGDNGEQTQESRDLLVQGSGIFPLKFIVSRPTGEELGYIGEDTEIDLDLGDTNDFEMRMNQDVWSRECYWYDNRIFIPQTEYGGIIDDLEVITSTREIVLRGPTWRGLLGRKVVEPPEGEDHLTVSGDLNDILRELIGDRFDGLFSVPDVKTGVTVTGWQVDRYVTLYDAIIKLLDSKGYRPQISYIEPEGLEYGYVTVQAVPVVDYSEDLEYSRESKVEFSIRDYRGGVNHLICAGKGQNEERVILHLYVQEDGSIGETQHYTGLAEHAATYEFSSADPDKLKEDGMKRLKDLQNYKSIDMDVSDIDLEIGDIVGGYEEITGTRLQKPVTRKIINTKQGKITINYEVKGDD